MDIVLGVSMAPSAVRMVLVEGESADGVTVDQDGFPVDEGADIASDRVVSAILGTLESAREGGYRLTSTGVTVSDQLQARLLREALADRKIRNVTLVSAFLAAAALAQAVGAAIGYTRTALLFVEPHDATLAVVDSADGEITEVRRVALPGDDTRALAELAALAAGVDTLASRPDGTLVVGSGVNVGMLKPQLEAASPIPVNAPEEPETALARGAALASAHAPLFDSSTSAVAWARDPGTGEIDPALIALGYNYVSAASADYDATAGEAALAYSAVGGDDPDADDTLFGIARTTRSRRPLLLAGSTLATLFVIGVTAFVIALAVGIRPMAANQPAPGTHLAAPPPQAPAPQAPPASPPAAAPAPAPAAPPEAPPPAAAPAPPPVVAPAPPIQSPAPAARHVPAPVPAAPAPVPEAAAPAPIPEAPPPVPAPAAPAPIPIPIPILLPAPIPAPIAPAPAAPAPVKPQLPAPTLPPIFSPPKQTPPKTGDLPGAGDGKRDGWPGWPGAGDGKRDGWPGWPGAGGGNRGGAPGLPGIGGGGNRGGAPGLPGIGGGNRGGAPGLPGFGGGGGRGGGGGLPGLFGGGGHRGFGF